jgi:hypothetical protein
MGEEMKALDGIFTLIGALVLTIPTIVAFIFVVNLLKD